MGFQMIVLDVVLLVAFLAVLARSAMFAITSLTNFSKILGISEFAVGFLILSIATSSPEISVAVFAVYSGDIGLTLGDIFGSNVTNIAMIAALFLLISPIKKVEQKTIRKLSTMLIVTALIALSLLGLQDGGRIVGIALLGFFGFFVYRTIKTSKKEPGIVKQAGSPYKQFLFFLAGITIVIISARIVVDSASSIAEYTGIRESVLGATIIAIGTSLPELVVDIVAVRRRQLELALGDIIGSSISNIALVLGLVLVLSEVTVNFGILSTLITFVVLSHLGMFLLLRTGRIARWQSFVLFAIYGSFLIAIYGLQTIISGFG